MTCDENATSVDRDLDVLWCDPWERNSDADFPVGVGDIDWGFPGEVVARSGDRLKELSMQPLGAIDHLARPGPHQASWVDHGHRTLNGCGCAPHRRVGEAAKLGHDQSLHLDDRQYRQLHWPASRCTYGLEKLKKKAARFPTGGPSLGRKCLEEGGQHPRAITPRIFAPGSRLHIDEAQFFEKYLASARWHPPKGGAIDQARVCQAPSF